MSLLPYRQHDGWDPGDQTGDCRLQDVITKRPPLVPGLIGRISSRTTKSNPQVVQRLRDVCLSVHLSISQVAPQHFHHFVYMTANLRTQGSVVGQKLLDIAEQLIELGSVLGVEQRGVPVEVQCERVQGVHGVCIESLRASTGYPGMRKVDDCRQPLRGVAPVYVEWSPLLFKPVEDLRTFDQALHCLEMLSKRRPVTDIEASRIVSCLRCSGPVAENIVQSAGGIRHGLRVPRAGA